MDSDDPLTPADLVVAHRFRSALTTATRALSRERSGGPFEAASEREARMLLATLSFFSSLYAETDMANRVVTDEERVLWTLEHPDLAAAGFTGPDDPELVMWSGFLDLHVDDKQRGRGFWDSTARTATPDPGHPDWRDVQFTPEQIVAWHALGVGPVAAHQWEQAGFSAAAAAPWIGKFSSPGEVTPWLSVPFDAADAPIPSQAAAWHYCGFTPENATRWLNAGFDLPGADRERDRTGKDFPIREPAGP